MKWPVKLKDFQYRLNLKKIVTNCDLKEWKLKENNSCTFCNEDAETITHLLWACAQVKRIIDIFYELCRNAGLIVERDCVSFLFCDKGKNTKNIMNFVNVFIKQYIYRCRCQGVKPKANLCMYELKKHQEIEYVIAKKKQIEPTSR